MAAKDTDVTKPDDQSDNALGDMSQAAVKKMISSARQRGYITYDELNAVLPPDQVSSEQIEDVMSMLSEMGINIIEDDEAEDEEAKSTDLVETSTSKEVVVATSTSARSSGWRSTPSATTASASRGLRSWSRAAIRIRIRLSRASRAATAGSFAGACGGSRRIRASIAWSSSRGAPSPPWATA